MKKYLKFIENVYDGNRLVWKKGKSYRVNDFYSNAYYVDAEGHKGGHGIDARSENKKYIIIEK